MRPRMETYKAESARIMDIISYTGAIIEPMSIDEAYLELSDVLLATRKFSHNDAALEAAVPIARTLKQSIFAQCQLTATIGIAPNKLLAKLASDFKKPDGLTLIPESGKVQFLRPLPVRAIHGVGRVTETVLNNAGIQTVADLQDYAGDLRALVGSFAATLKAFAFGDDNRPIEIDDTIKSISSEETFLHDTDDRRVLRKSLRDQAADVAAKLKRKQLAAATVQVKLRYGDFTTLTRQISVEEPLTDQRKSIDWPAFSWPARSSSAARFGCSASALATWIYPLAANSPFGHSHKMPYLKNVGWPLRDLYV